LPGVSRPRVLIVITLAEVGGAQTYVASLLPALTARYDVTVAAWGAGPLIEATRAAGATYVPLRHMRRDLSPVDDLRAVFELIGLCRRLRPDIVHLNSSKAGVLGRIAGLFARVPVRIFTVHGWAFKATNGSAARMYLLAERLMRPLTTTTICVSQTEKRAGLAARTCGAGAIVIENAVDVAATPSVDPRRDPPHVVSVGRLKAPKDFVTLARALRTLEAGTFTATIVGDGPDRGEVERELGNAGWVAGERHDVGDQLSRSDLFVLSTTSEGMPLTVLEAMAAGLPVVASNVGGLPELVEDGITGILVPPRDPAALATALRGLIAAPERRAALGAAGRARVQERFDLPRFRAAHVELYESMLARRRRR
jgi:glycosyltransferase involved in cell wall biosynthesis